MSAFIESQKAAGFAVELVCRTLGMSRSAHYARKTGPPSPRTVRDAELVETIRKVHRENFEAYGYRKMQLALRRHGVEVGRDRVKRLMRAHGIQGAKRRGKRWKTTTLDPHADRVAARGGLHPCRSVATNAFERTEGGRLDAALAEAAERLDIFSRRNLHTRAVHRNEPSRSIPRMVLVEVLTGSVGVPVVRAVVKQWVGDSALLDNVVDDAAQLLAKAGLDFLERRRVSRELDEITERIAERLRPFFEAEEFGGLQSNEREAAAYAVGRAVERGFTDPSVALKADMDAARLEARLRELSPTAPEDERLNELAERLYDIALAETCAYLVAMVENLPRFSGVAFAELLARDRAVLEKLDAALENLPQTDAEKALNFETRYVREVARQLDQLRLHGFTASAEVRRYQLSVAYISLSVSVEDSPDALPLSANADAREGDWPIGIVDIQDETQGHTSPEEDLADEAQTVRVEDVVRTSPRLLIRGDAGSGKTTLLSWLAVNAARRSFDDSLEDLIGLVPFFVSLRGYADEPLPAPAAFVDSIAVAIKGLMPSDFVEQSLDAGRGLVLIDGVDELAPERREDAKLWLDSLTAAYPESRYVVTSRPPAVEEDWLEELDFSSCVLENMSLADVDSFIDHWHDAIDAGTDGAAREKVQLEARQLKITVRRQAPLRRLAESPLLCAMLCALHHDGSAQLPKDRIELYDRALEALLERRDADRRVVVSDGLSLRHKREILRDLAYWFLRNGYTVAPRERVIEQLGRSLDNLHLDRGPGQTFESLLERTGLLREPVVDRVDWIHRTFLEYLAAQAIVEEDDLGYLVAQAHSDTFSEVVVLAAGVGNAHQRNELISGLLARADAGDAASKRLQLLAVASLETATKLDSVLRDRVQSVLTELVPPENLTAANELASAGDLAVDLLAPRTDPPLLAVEARACVRTLGLVGSERSLEQLAQYGDDDRITVVRELFRQWSNFDYVEYAKRVLADSPLFNGELTVRGDEGLSVVRYLKMLRFLTVAAGGAVVRLSPLAGLDQLAGLAVQHAAGLTSLIEALPLRGLRSLNLLDLPDFASLSGVEEMGDLAVVTLRRCPALFDIEPLRGHPGLRRLVVTGTDHLDLGPLQGLGLEALEIGVEYPTTIDVLSELPDLRTVTFSGMAGDLELFPLVDAAGLESVFVGDCTGSVVAAPLGSEGRPLRYLSISGTPSLQHQVAEFGEIETLRLEITNATQLRGLHLSTIERLILVAPHGDRVPQLPPVKSLELSMDRLTVLDGVGSPELQDIQLQCRDLRDLSALLDAPSLRSVTVVDVSEDADLTPLGRLPTETVVTTSYEIARRIEGGEVRTVALPAAYLRRRVNGRRPLRVRTTR